MMSQVVGLAGTSAFAGAWSTIALRRAVVPNKWRFNDWGGRGYDDSVPEEVTKTTPSGYRTT